MMIAVTQGGPGGSVQVIATLAKPASWQQPSYPTVLQFPTIATPCRSLGSTGSMCTGLFGSLPAHVVMARSPRSAPAASSIRYANTTIGCPALEVAFPALPGRTDCSDRNAVRIASRRPRRGRRARRRDPNRYSYLTAYDHRRISADRRRGSQAPSTRDSRVRIDSSYAGTLGPPPPGYRTTDTSVSGKPGQLPCSRVRESVGLDRSGSARFRSPGMVKNSDVP
jgi:hypothetical protein